MIILLCSIIIATNVRAQPPTVVKGYVYIDGIITMPEEVHLMFPSQSRIGNVYSDGRYIIVFTGESTGSTGEFYIIYNGLSYTPAETITLLEDEYLYNIDLHVTISGGGPTEPPVEDPTNAQPKADAGGPYYKVVNTEVNFNGSASYDSDGAITTYEWDFGDDETSEEQSPTHTYSSIGNYQVTLTVTDNKGKTDIDVTYAYITETESYPPTQPEINGTTEGKANTLYNYTIYSTDIENDTIQYVFDWGDDTDTTSSHFLENGTTYTTNHSWTDPGIYTLTAYAIDENNVVSEPNETIVLIDAIFVKEIGYMVDFTNDGYYDLFHSNTTNEETPVEKNGDLYLIDDDNDGTVDYVYNIETNILGNYSGPATTTEESTSFYDMILPFIPYLIIGIVIIVVLIIAVLIAKKPKKTKKTKETKEKKVKKEKKEKKKKEKPAEEKKIEKQEKEQTQEDVDIQKIRDEIDKL